jgi:hypothetical protein
VTVTTFVAFVDAPMSLFTFVTMTLTSDASLASVAHGPWGDLRPNRPAEAAA